MQDTDQSNETKYTESLINYVKGFIMGSADIVPGVSGGTMALILGIYERFINAIKSVDMAFFMTLKERQWQTAFDQIDYKFLGILIGGIFTAILFFTKVVPLQVYMYTDPEVLYGAFFGLIIGSVIILHKTLEQHTWREALFTVVGISIGYWVVTLVPGDTPDNPAFVFLSGVIAISAMVLPGISGSYMLLILRKYEFLLSNIGKLGTEETGSAIVELAPFVLGTLVGLALFTRFLSWLLGKYHSQTLALLIGFLMGSLIVIWPFQERLYIEFTEKTELVNFNDSRVQELLEGEVNENQPEFYRLGVIINEDAELEELRMAQLITIKKKLISSEPYVPFGEEYEDTDIPVTNGLLAMVVGFLFVGVVEQLRKRTEDDS